MSLFRSDTARDVWRGHWCERCHHPEAITARRRGAVSGCHILERALSSQRKPVEWDRNTRAQTMDAAYRCNAALDQPAVLRRVVAEDHTLTMFDVTPVALSEGDHA